MSGDLEKAFDNRLAAIKVIAAETKLGHWKNKDLWWVYVRLCGGYGPGMEQAAFSSVYLAIYNIMSEDAATEICRSLDDLLNAAREKVMNLRKIN